MNATADKTYVRITDGGFPRLITRRQAADEIDSAISGQLREQVVQMSASRAGANLTYGDGRRVEIREATDAELATPVCVGGSFTGHIPGDDGRTICGKVYSNVLYPVESISRECRACVRRSA